MIPPALIRRLQRIAEEGGKFGHFRFVAVDSDEATALLYAIGRQRVRCREVRVKRKSENENGNGSDSDSHSH